jgi:hypothetical protein
MIILLPGALQMLSQIGRQMIQHLEMLFINAFAVSTIQQQH